MSASYNASSRLSNDDRVKTLNKVYMLVGEAIARDGFSFDDASTMLGIADRWAERLQVDTLAEETQQDWDDHFSRNVRMNAWSLYNPKPYLRGEGCHIQEGHLHLANSKSKQKWARSGKAARRQSAR